MQAARCASYGSGQIGLSPKAPVPLSDTRADFAAGPNVRGIVRSGQSHDRLVERLSSH